MKDTPGYTHFQMNQRMSAQERNSMASMSKQPSGASKGATGNMKTVARVAKSAHPKTK